MKYKNHKVEKRNDGRWQIRIRENGKQIYCYGKTQEECLAKIKNYYLNKNHQISKRLKLFEAWQYWFDKYKKHFYKERTLKNIKSVFKNQISKYFDDKYLSEINSLELNLAINSIEQPRMKEFAYQYIKEFLSAMYKEKKIKCDIASEIKPYHSKRKEGKSLTNEERKILIEKSYLIKDGELFRFYLFSGVRPAEIYLIKRTDIEKDFIHIPGTKTEKSDRYIPKFKQLEEIINNLKTDSEYLFKISDTTKKRRLCELRKLCGFHFNIKDLRTTFATMCAENGIQQNVIAKWLGHSNVSTTNKYYIKVLSDYEKQQIKNLEINIDSQIDTHFDTQKG